MVTKSKDPERSKAMLGNTNAKGKHNFDKRISESISFTKKTAKTNSMETPQDFEKRILKALEESRTKEPIVPTTKREKAKAEKVLQDAIIMGNNTWNTKLSQYSKGRRSDSAQRLKDINAKQAKEVRKTVKVK